MTKALASLALVVLALLSGCAPDRIPLDSPVAISPDFSPEQTVMVLQAIEQWKADTAGKVELKPFIGTGGGGADIAISPGERAGLMGNTHLTHSIDRFRADIEINLHNVADGANIMGVTFEENLQNVVMHELGHAFGVPHKDHTLMWPGVFSGNNVDTVTRIRLLENYP